MTEDDRNYGISNRNRMKVINMKWWMYVIVFVVVFYITAKKVGLFDK